MEIGAVREREREEEETVTMIFRKHEVSWQGGGWKGFKGRFSVQWGKQRRTGRIAS